LAGADWALAPKAAALQSPFAAKAMKPTVSIAIETSCRCGGVALGLDDRLARVADFDASSRHATTLVVRLKSLLASAHLRPADLSELYVSVGPGSFTGVRVGVTVARTLAQVISGLRCVAVPTALVVAHRAGELEWCNLAVILDARQGCVHATLFARRGKQIVPAAQPVLATPAEFLAAAPRPLLLTGEGLGYHELSGEDVAQVDPSLRMPTAECLWRVGRCMAQAGQFTDCHRLLPIYVRDPSFCPPEGHRA
jgi:tRNA threonylcarbamoyladenosine biosynthesis protein TsaB